MGSEQYNVGTLGSEHNVAYNPTGITTVKETANEAKYADDGGEIAARIGPRLAYRKGDQQA